MFGLMLLGIVVVWVLVTIPIARWLGKKLPDKPWRKAAQVALFPLIFVVPIFDEIIAWPQMKVLCQDGDDYRYSDGMTEENAKNRTVFLQRRDDRQVHLFPTINVRTYRDVVVDARTGETILEGRVVEPLSSVFAFPDAGGGRHTWLLRGCPQERDQALQERTRSLLNEKLKLKIIDSSKAVR